MRQQERKKAWLYVFLTSFFELVWIYGFNVASVWWHWIFIVFFIIIDFHFLTKACENLPTGTVYAVFAAVGTVGVVLMDVLFFNDTLNGTKILFITIIVLGVICLNIAGVLDEKRALRGVNRDES